MIPELLVEENSAPVLKGADIIIVVNQLNIIRHLSENVHKTVGIDLSLTTVLMEPVAQELTMDLQVI